MFHLVLATSKTLREPGKILRIRDDRTTFLGERYPEAQSDLGAGRSDDAHLLGLGRSWKHVAVGHRQHLQLLSLKVIIGG